MLPCHERENRTLFCIRLPFFPFALQMLSSHFFFKNFWLAFSMLSSVIWLKVIRLPNIRVDHSPATPLKYFLDIVLNNTNGGSLAAVAASQFWSIRAYNCFFLPRWNGRRRRRREFVCLANGLEFPKNFSGEMVNVIKLIIIRTSSIHWQTRSFPLCLSVQQSSHLIKQQHLLPFPYFRPGVSVSALCIAIANLTLIPRRRFLLLLLLIKKNLPFIT